NDNGNNGDSNRLSGVSRVEFATSRGLCDTPSEELNMDTPGVDESPIVQSVSIQDKPRSDKNFPEENSSPPTRSIRTPQQNRVVKQRNQTLVKVARIMLIFPFASLFLWTEVIANVCYTQHRSLIHRRFDKTPYELINGKKLDISFLYVFGALCYPKNDRKDIGMLGVKGDIGFFIGYSANSRVYRVYNRRTKKIMEIMNVTFDELSPMAFEQRSLKLEL
ncbi:retrovirus-related pol polyprotein from transposon TNT 1-94, partial [Tanacetum coccineum]